MTRRSAPPDAWGIVPGYEDALDRWREVPAETLEAIRRAMGSPDGEAGALRAGLPVPAEGDPPVRVVAEGTRPSVGPGTLVLEDGTELEIEERLPSDLPPGYHRLLARSGAGSPAGLSPHPVPEEGVLLVVAPPRCHLPPDLSTWGWAVQLYAARSERSWGIGDLADLRTLAEWAGDQGAGTMLLSPLGAPTPVHPVEPSPYYPSSRRFRSPLHLAVDEVPGASSVGSELEDLSARGRALNRERRIDRDEVWRLKRRALEALWARFRDGPGAAEFTRWRRGRGRALQEFAVFCALADVHGRGWAGWPEEYRRPGTGAVRRFADEQEERVAFHAWLQWLLDRQLARAAAGPVHLMMDLPIGVAPDGADAWAWQDLLASGVSVGAPPDAFNAAGQDWGLPPFVPWKLRRAAYRPLIETLRATLAHGRWLRIDHVMGLFRLFWIPAGAGPQDGAYVRYPSDELLAILALESHRSGSVVVGEDLGTVEEGVREAMAQRDILSYRLLWFEDEPPEDFPREAMAAATTHDLPTVAGLWTGADLEAQRNAGLEPPEEGTAAIRERVRRLTGLAPGAGVEAVVAAVHESLGRAPSRILTATLEDAMAVEERPNVPGASAWPSWSLALPRPIETLRGDPLADRIARALGREEG